MQQLFKLQLCFLMVKTFVYRIHVIILKVRTKFQTDNRFGFSIARM